MSFSVVNNLPALGAYNALSGANKNLANAINHLSSGLRINGAKDDPSGLAISERFKGQISGLNQASMNAQDGTSMLQVADGALNETQAILQRMRELAVQASNGTLTSQDRTSIQDEVDQLKDEVNRISTTTEFNTKKLLNGNLSGIWSTDHPDQLHAYITGQVREGNYRISVQASATGNNEVWKSDVMELASPYKANVDTLTVQLNNTNGSMLSTAGITVDQNKVAQDATYVYKFQQGQAAEIAGASANASVTIAHTEASWTATQAVAVLTAASNVHIGAGDNAYATGTETFLFHTSTIITFSGAGATGGSVAFAAGTYSLFQVESALHSYGLSNEITVTWSANGAASGGFFATVTNATAKMTVTVTGDDALGINGLTIASAGGTTRGSQNSENANLFLISANGGGGLTSAFATTSFDIISNGHSATVSFNLWQHGSSAVATQVIALNENDVLDTMNTALAANKLGVRAQVDNNHVLSLVTTTADGTTRPSSFSISNLVRATSAANSATIFSVTSLGIKGGSFTGTGNNEIVFSVNQSTIYTATLADKTYTTTADLTQLASDMQTAMNNAVLAGGGSTANEADVVFDTAGMSFHVMSRQIGYNTSAASEIQLYAGAGLQSILSSVGLDLNTHARGNNDGMSLAIYNNAAGTNLATHIYNRRGIDTGAATLGWSAAGAVNVSSDKTLAALGLNLSFATTAAVAGNAGNFMFDVTKIGDQISVAKGTNTLGQISQFAGLLDQTRNMTIYANGQKAFIYFDKSTTLDQLQNMIASAITTDITAGGLGLKVNGAVSAQQTVYDHVSDFITNTSEGTYRQPSGDAAVDGTLIVRSPWAGTAGQIFFGADEDIQNAFSFARIKNASDDAGVDPWFVQVQDAHTGENLFSRKVAAPEIDNLIPGVNVKFSPTVDVNTTWNTNSGQFDFTADSSPQSMVLHVVDRHLDLAVGANAGQNISTSIGEINTGSLGLDNVLVVDPTLAQRSIAKIDKAVNQVSSERARMGAVMNRLDYTINTLAVQSQNMTAAESTITDLDMAKTVSYMTKYQILNQAGTAMLAQANQLNQSLLSLLK
ncbi:MAG: hypothetical protein HQK57_02630 [Deltaproteobacteria bacterium]|nr:hypothetical protein [Deltaproteobacteria bacterium]